jgi:hypothetical protein
MVAEENWCVVVAIIPFFIWPAMRKGSGHRSQYTFVAATDESR